MRVTAETKQLTRKRILDAAQELFRTTGYEATTTRDIARAAQIATGTLFNYFPTKEAIVAGLIRQVPLRSAASESEETYDSLEEALFAHVAATLRRFKPYRSYLVPVLETALSPLAELHPGDDVQVMRTEHLERVLSLATAHHLQDAMTDVAIQLYWTLYLGVLTFWTRDKSPQQEDTLALLDQSLAMFVGWLRSGAENGSDG